MAKYAPPVPLEEQARLEALQGLGILDTAPEPAFDAIVRLASTICQAPIALITLVDARRQWFKANLGLETLRETPRKASFAAHAIVGNDRLEVPDTQLDPRFLHNPMVTGEPHIRFYAGQPLLVNGFRMGTLCVMDQVPRGLTEAQRDALDHLAALVVALLQECRHRAAALPQLPAGANREAGITLLHESMKVVLDNMPAMMAFWDGKLVNRFANRDYAEWAGKPFEEIIGRHIKDVLRPAVYEANVALIEKAMQGKELLFEREMLKNGQLRYMQARYIPHQNERGEADGFFVLITDITERRRAELALASSERSYRRVLDAAQMGIWVYDTGSMNVSLDEYSRRHFGLHDGSLSVEKFISLVNPEDRPRLIRALNRSDNAVRNGDGEMSFEVRTECEYGGERWLEIVARVNDAAMQGKAGKTIITGSSRDITERKLLLADVSEQHERLRVTLHSIGDAVITTDPQGLIEYLNPVAESLTGWSNEEAHGRQLEEVFRIVSEATGEPVANPVEHCLNESHRVESNERIVLLSRDGREYGIEESAAPISDAAGRISGVVLVFHDVTEQRRLAGEVYFQATHDSLTGLVNRKEFERRLQVVLESSRGSGLEHAFLFVDLDQFKLVNDVCGHAVGDRLLQNATALIEKCVRAVDTVSRLGGDEFGVILEGCDIESARQVAEKICARLNEFLFVHDGQRFHIGASIGLVMVDSHWQDIGELVQAADSACYVAKNSGRGCVQTYFENDQAVAIQKGQVNWATRLTTALDNDQFELYAQLISPTSRAHAGLHCEVLIRMRGDNGEIIPPGAFMPSAERFHMASRIDKWVIRNVLSLLEAHQGMLHAVDHVAINLSGQSLGNREFHRYVEELLAQTTVDLHRICFEVTETSAIASLDDARGFIARVAAFGVKFSLDDFGSGMSSFAYLKTLPVDYLKIDGQFVRNLTGDEVDVMTVKCMADLGRAMGKKTIAEFVETEGIRQILQDLGVDYVQGYLMHKPEPLLQVLARHDEMSRTG